MKSKSLVKKIFILLILIFCSEVTVFAQNDEVTTITIKNARRTEYKKNEETGNDSIILEGAVELTVEKGDDVSDIRADKVVYDRKTEMLYGEGNVEIISKSSSGDNDRTTAESILLNTSTLEGVFDDGRVVQTGTDSFSLPSGSVLVVFSDIFGKTNNNVIAFKNSRLSFCDDEDPHWQIKATRTYLLPGGEFAFLNALLYVGPVPVMYFPAFYYPKDELIFNPVFSYKPRSGYSVQTTLYLYGRKPLDTSASSSSSSSTTSDSTATQAIKSIQNFFRPSVLKEQELQGLMLHNLGKNDDDVTSNYVKIMADMYSKMGVMFGIDAVTNPSKYLTSLKAGLNIAFSNTVFENGTQYSNFSPITGKKYSDDSNFMGLKIPFRYSGNLGLVLTKPVSINVTLPIYSDPYFNYDFLLNRSENMDWISYFIESATLTSSSKETVSEISSFSWKMTSSYNASIPEFLKPFISTVSVSTSSQLDIASLENSVIKPASNNNSVYVNTNQQKQDTWYLYTPKRKFYYPSQITPLVANVSLSGTLFQWPWKSSSSSSSSNNDYLITMNKPDYLKSEAQLEAEKKEKELAEKKAAGELDESEETEENESADKEKDRYYNPVLPSLEFSPEVPAAITGITYNLDYSVNPSLTTQLSYASTNLKEPEDFTWDRVRSFMYTFTSPVSVSSKFNYAGSFFSCVNTMAYEPLLQDHPYISEDLDIGGYSKSTAEALRLADFNAQKQDITETNQVGLFPLTYIPIVGGTGITWNSSIKLFRRKFLGDIDNPEWENLTVDWESDECITSNNVNLVLSSIEKADKFGQVITLSTNLPPQLRQYSATIDFIFPYTKLSASSGFTQASKTDPTWKKNPLQQSLSVSLFNSTLSFTESFNYNLEDKNPDSLKFALSWKGITADYQMSYTTGYNFDSQKGWIARTEKEFLPYSAGLSYSSSLPTFRTWFNRITLTPGLNTSIVADCIKPTSSYFTFVPRLTFEINEFLSFTFSATVKNSVIYRYAQTLFGHPGRIPGEQNMFIDLFDSYRFDNETLRKSSGFKIKSINFEVNHNLHDWNFKMSFKMEPRLLTEKGVTQYDFNPYITIGVIWKPMEAVKTQIVDDYGEWKIE